MKTPLLESFLDAIIVFIAIVVMLVLIPLSLMLFGLVVFVCIRIFAFLTQYPYLLIVLISLIVFCGIWLYRYKELKARQDKDWYISTYKSERKYWHDTHKIHIDLSKGCSRSRSFAQKSIEPKEPPIRKN